MKKRKLLTALLICTAMSLQSNAADIGSWSGVTDAFVTGGDFSLMTGIQADKITGDSDKTYGSNAAYFFNDGGTDLILNLGGNTITGNGADYYDSLFEIGEHFKHESSGANRDLTITNGVISGFTGSHLFGGMPSTGTVGVANSASLKEICIDFINNTNDIGGAISNITTNMDNVSSVIASISGEFTNNNAVYLGGAIYNSGANLTADEEGLKGFDVTRNLNTQITITTDGKDTVFNGNKAGVAGGAIFNTGTVNIEADENNSVVFETESDTIYNAGVLNINSGETVVNSGISDEVKTVQIGNFEQKFGGTGVTNIAEDGVLTLGDGAAITQQEINVDGALYAENGGAITGSLKISETGTADLNADNLKNEVSNNGDIAIWGGTLNQDIKGDGTTVIVDEVTNNAVITQGSFGIEKEGEENGKLITNADKLVIADKEIHNYGTLVLTGGTNENKITSTDTDGYAQEGGLTIIKGDVTNNAIIAQNIEVQSGVLKSNANNITGAMTVNNNAVYNITGAANNSNSITMTNGSTLSLMDEAANDVTLDKLAISSGEVVELKFDWGDTLNSSSEDVKGSFNVTEVDLTSTTGADSYEFTNTLTDKIDLDSNIKLIANETSNNVLNYDSTNGYMSSKRSTLAGAVNETEDSSLYAMTGNESAGNETLTGNLTVQGNGHSITDGGIIIGDGRAGGSKLELQDVNLDGIKIEGSSQGAIHINGGNELKLSASTKDITVKGSSGNSTSAVYLQSDTNGIAKATINAQGGTIIISDDIMSDNKDNQVVFTGNKNITFSGKFDPVLATVNMSNAELTRDGQDDAIDWNLNGGTLHYTNDGYLSGGTNSVNFNGGSLDLRNGAVNTVDLSSLTLSNSSNVYLDVDLANKTMDSFNTSNVNVADDSARMHVAGLNLISDAAEDNTTINFIPEKSLAGYVDYTGSQGLTALSPIYKYNVAYDESNGNFDFTRFAAGGGYKSYNPAVMASPVAAQLGGYLTQLNSYDEAFRNMDMYMLMTQKQREAMKFRNKYAASDSNLVFDSTADYYENKAVWARPYATFEKVPLKNGPKVSNVAYGSFFGAESGLYDLGHGWDGMAGVYAGYNGSHQAYDGIGIYQNGGTLGLVGMAYKGNFFTGLTINAGANIGEANTIYGTDNFTMLMTGVANKTGYNVELADGKFIIQPNVQLSYSFINTFDYTNAAGVRMNSDALNAIQVEPGIKFIGNLRNGWQPYAGVSMVWNIIDETKFQANNVALPELSVKPYVRYGLGVRKLWGDRSLGYLQTYFANGGRNGVGFQAGFRFALGD